MGRLTTHVLDTARGLPAANLNIELWQLDEPARLLKRITTNSDGRADEPLLDGETFKTGTYELRFFAGNYLHYHVPLLLSPYGYSTYRGS
jgi:5-hydroxyisourate hydrolase